jgi:hypothetical protein
VTDNDTTGSTLVCSRIYDGIAEHNALFEGPIRSAPVGREKGDS